MKICTETKWWVVFRNLLIFNGPAKLRQNCVFNRGHDLLLLSDSYAVSIKFHNKTKTLSLSIPRLLFADLSMRAAAGGRLCCELGQQGPLQRGK